MLFRSALSYRNTVFCPNREKANAFEVVTIDKDVVSEKFSSDMPAKRRKGERGQLPWKIGTRLSRVHIQQCLGGEPSRTPSLQLARVGFLVA